MILAILQTGAYDLRRSFEMLPLVRRIFITFILGDLIFIAVHILRVFALKNELVPFNSILESPLFALDVDGGYSEGWQYIKEFGAAILLLLSTFRATQAAAYGGWSLLFAFTGLDDSLELHERAGAFLAQFLPQIAESLPNEDLGQFLFAIAAGLILLGIIICATLHSAPVHAARSGLLVFPLAGLAACGVAIDLVHAIVGYKFTGSNLILTVLEDGGEMLFMSFGCVLAFATFMRAAEPCVPQAPLAE